MTHRLSPVRLDKSRIRPLLRKALQEDSAWNDRTTLATVPASLKTRGEILAKGSGILAGLPVAEEVFRVLDPKIRFKALVREGASIRKGLLVARLEGPARSLLSGERVALNLLCRLSGIATLTHSFSRKIQGPRLYDTRKTTPLWRSLERYAVAVGGGQNHRFDLSEHVLIKDNHRSLGGGVYACVMAARRKYGRREFIEAEVETFEQASEALRAGADMILVDNADPKLLRRILKLVKGKMGVEVSGGLTLSNIGRYSKLPADRFSSGSLTHSAPSLDFSIEYYPF